ncbi:unnamed protein product, partial [Didymodactylos carnosus]
MFTWIIFSQHLELGLLFATAPPTNTIINIILTLIGLPVLFLFFAHYFITYELHDFPWFADKKNNVEEFDKLLNEVTEIA